jgi:hypothetical protein
MVTAIVLITCEVDRTSETAETLADLDGISEVYSVAGDWDLAAIVRVGSHDDLAATVTNHIRKTPGVATTNTLIAFRTYSRHDLDSMFSVGFEAAGQPDWQESGSRAGPVAREHGGPGARWPGSTVVRACGSCGPE